MSVYEITFSPTGGTKKVSDIFTKSFSPESTYIDLISQKTDYTTYAFGPEDICIVSVPSYGGRVPDIAAKRLGQMKGNGAKAVLITVYGNRDYDDTFAELQDVLEDCVRCGYCAKECPVGAISAEDPSETDNEKCISCMRCIAVCPQKARNVSKAMLIAGSMKLKKACSGYKENKLFL